MFLRDPGIDDLDPLARDRQILRHSVRVERAGRDELVHVLRPLADDLFRLAQVRLGERVRTAAPVRRITADGRL